MEVVPPMENSPEQNSPEPSPAACPPALLDRLRQAVREHPDRMTLQVARDFGVPEVEVIRAFPEDRALELDARQWEPLIRSFETLGRVRVLVSSGAATLEAVGQFGGFSTFGDYFNAQTSSLDMHIRWRELAAIFAIEKPGHLDRRTTYSFQFFDRTGRAAFKVFLNFGETLVPERLRLFCELRARYRAHSGPSAEHGSH